MEKNYHQEVKDLLTEPQKRKKDGEKVNPTEPIKTKVEVEDGTWTFEGYDRNEDKINKGNQNFAGTWVFEENKKTPFKSNNINKLPATGDMFNKSIYSIVAVSSFLLMVSVLIMKKKED